MTDHMKKLAFSLAVIPMAAVYLWAQQPNMGANNGESMQGMQMGNRQGMMGNGMMQGCQKNMQSMMEANTQTTKDIETASQSNDPQKMRAALDEAAKTLNSRNEQMKTCMGQMNKMQNMKDMHGMMNSGQKSGGQSGSSTSPK
jgi:hypothetical protein